MKTVANQNNRKSHNQRHWRAHIKAQKRSGLNRAEYCRQHELSYHAMTYWFGKLSTPSSKTTLVPVSLKNNIEQNTIQADRAALKINLPGRVAIEIGNNFSPATLTRLLDTLESR